MRSKNVVLIIGLVSLGICAKNSTCLGKVISTQASPLSRYAGPNSIGPSKLFAGPELTRSAELTVRDGSEGIPPQALLIRDGSEGIPPQALLIRDGSEGIPPQALLIRDGSEGIPPQALSIRDGSEGIPPQAFLIRDGSEGIPPVANLSIG